MSGLAEGSAPGSPSYQVENAIALLTTGMHVMVAYGYDGHSVYINDPGKAVSKQYDWTSFL